MSRNSEQRAVLGALPVAWVLWEWDTLSPSALFPLSTAEAQTRDTGLTFGQEQLCTKAVPTCPAGFNIFLCPVEENAQERRSRSCSQHFPWNVMPRLMEEACFSHPDLSCTCGGTAAALPGGEHLQLLMKQGHVGTCPE